MVIILASPIGERIKSLRKARHMTQGELATNAHVGRSWLSIVESGELTNPGGERLDRVANQLGVSSRYLLTGRDAQENDETQSILNRMRRFPPRILDRLDRIGDLLSEDVPDDDAEEETGEE